MRTRQFQERLSDKHRRLSMDKDIPGNTSQHPFDSLEPPAADSDNVSLDLFSS